MIANSDHSQALSPPKTIHPLRQCRFPARRTRIGDKNIYFDQFSYELNLKEMKLPPSKTWINETDEP